MNHSSTVNTARRAAAPLLAALALLATGARAADAPPAFTPGQGAAAAADTFVKTYGLDKLKTRRIAITSFGVEFNRKIHVHATTRNLATDTYYNGRTDFVLSGVDDATMQRIADRAYARFVAELTQAGFEVLSFDTLRANAAVQTLMRDAGAAQRMTIEYKLSKRFDNERDVTSLVLAPTGLQYYEPEIDEDEGRGPAGDNAAGVIGNLGKNIGAKAGRKIRIGEVAVAKELNANVLKARFVIGFGDASASVASAVTYKTDWINEKVTKQLEVNRSSSVRSRLSVLGRGETYVAFRTEEASPYRKERTTVHTSKGGLLSALVKTTDAEAMDGNVTLWLAESVDSNESFLADGVRTQARPDEKKESGVMSLTKSVGGILAGTSANKSGSVSNSDGSSFVAEADPELYEYLASAYMDAARAMLIVKLPPAPR